MIAPAVLLLTFAAASEPDGDARTPQIVVVTYNILAGDRGLDGIADTLKRADADIIGLQEVDRGTRRSGKRDQASILAKKLGMHARFVSFFDYQGGEFGLALLSKHPIVDVKRRRVKGSRLSLLDAIVKTPHGEVRVIVCHFTVTFPFRDEKETRATEKARLLEAKAAAKIASMEKKRPVIVVGDMNDDSGSPTYEQFSPLLQDACDVKGMGFAKTWNSAFPITRIDYVWASKDFVVEECSTIKSEASDHLPVRARLSLPRDRDRDRDRDR